MIFKNRIGNVHIGGYYINLRNHKMNKEEYLNELKEQLIQNNKDDRYIIACCNYAAKLIDANLPVIFDNTHLSLLIGITPFNLGKLLYSIDDYCYKEIKIPKKSGGKRTLHIPSVELKYIQRWILDNILYNCHISNCANGFAKNKSILTNAKQHLHSECIINIDLKDFFPSVKFEEVFRIFKYYGYTKELSYTFAKLCTYQGILPQGSPASPALTNIICLKLDKRLLGLAQKYNATYSRYADDITFSGNRSITHLLPIATEIIQNEGFMLNQKKTRISYNHQKQEVTGLIVNGDTVHISKQYKRKLRQEIYYCMKYGVKNHQEKINDNHAFYKEHLYGQAYFIHMIEPDLGEKYLSMLDNIAWEY